MSANGNSNQTARTLITFSCAIIALVLLIIATQVEMPLQAILIAMAFSEILFVVLVMLGKILPDRRR